MTISERLHDLERVFRSLAPQLRADYFYSPIDKEAWQVMGSGCGPRDRFTEAAIRAAGILMELDHVVSPEVVAEENPLHRWLTFLRLMFPPCVQLGPHAKYLGSMGQNRGPVQTASIDGIAELSALAIRRLLVKVEKQSSAVPSISG